MNVKVDLVDLREVVIHQVLANYIDSNLHSFKIGVRIYRTCRIIAVPENLIPDKLFDAVFMHLCRSVVTHRMER